MQSQQQYRGYAPPHGQPAPSRREGRRGGIGPMMSAGPHPHAPISHAQMNKQHFQAQEASRLAKISSRKPTDKNLPDGIDELLVGGPDLAIAYRKLRDHERRLDATITRKRLDIVEAANRNTKHYKTLRIWITNTVEDQFWQTNSGLNSDSFDFSTTQESSYRVKIEGRLLDDDLDLEKDDEEEEVVKAEDGQGDKMDTDEKPKQKSVAAKPGQRTRFSHFFKALTVEPDRPKAANRPNNNETIVEWKKPDRTPAGAQNLPAMADFDELTFKRPGDENMNITINLYRHEDPERFAVSKELSDIIGENEATRQEAVMGVYQYIQLFKLQEDEEARNFRCDDYLRKIVGRDLGAIPQLADYITPHLRPLPPVQLSYTIRVDEEFHRNPQSTVYDVLVAVDDPLRAKYLSFLQNPQNTAMFKEISRLDDQLAIICQAIAESKAKHTFFTAMAKDPVHFVRDWLSSQKRDLEVILGEATRGGGEDATGDEWRKGGRESVWNTANARESVNVLLSKQR